MNVYVAVENGGSEMESSAADQLADTDKAALADDTADNDDDGGAGDGREIPDAEVKLKVAESGQCEPCNSRPQFDVAERQSATLYLSRLSQFLPSLVSDVTSSSLEADKLLQQFSSTFCTGITRSTLPVL